MLNVYMVWQMQTEIKALPLFRSSGAVLVLTGLGSFVLFPSLSSSCLSVQSFFSKTCFPV